ncbi:MAG TPA: hypothetical protein VI757_09295 [Bacteroidia bacterium]|nr:hypothetical protein [Bacteroidia bacterium]
MTSYKREIAADTRGMNIDISGITPRSCVSDYDSFCSILEIKVIYSYM